VNGKKISGCAQTRRNGKLLQHGTLILDVNVDRMFEVLRVPDEKIKGKQISQVKERVTSINKELDREISIEQIEKAIVLGFEKKFNIKFFEGRLSEEEILLARKLKGEFEKDEFKNFT
jgi:lipoate-protein ligase A